MDPKDTQRLVEDASRGDSYAVEDLLARFLPDLQRYVRRQAGGLVAAKESSSDLVQSVCRELLERLGTERFEYRSEGEFKQWLYRAAVLKISSRHRFWTAAKRDAAREAAPPQGSSTSPEQAWFRSQATPSRQAAMKEEIERLQAVFDQLPERHREIITLAHVDGLSHKAIAERLGVTESHSRVLLSRALAKLASLAIESGEAPPGAPPDPRA